MNELTAVGLGRRAADYEIACRGTERDPGSSKA
jgi:hypothetical protein